MSDWKDYSTAKYLYEEEEYSIAEITDKLDAPSYQRMRNYLIKSGIHLPKGDEPYKDKEVLKKLYIEEDMTQEEMADFFGVNQMLLNNLLQYHDIEKGGTRGRQRYDGPSKDEIMSGEAL